MKRELLVIDLILAALVGGAVFKVQRDWIAFEATHDAAAIRFAGEALTPPAMPEDGSVAELEDWTAIALENPFSFDRNDIAIVAAEPVEPAGPRPVLFGTVALGGEPMAMLAPGQTGSRAYRPVKVGEVIDGWRLLEIAAKSVVVESGGMRQTVLMNDPTAQVPRDQRRTLSRGGAAPQVSTVQTPSSPEVPSQPASRPSAGRATTNPTAPSPDNVPPGFRAIQTPFGTKVLRDTQ